MLLWMWIFGQTLWSDVDQNLTICTPVLTGHDAGVGTALSATHEAPAPLMLSTCQLKQGGR